MAGMPARNWVRTRGITFGRVPEAVRTRHGLKRVVEAIGWVLGVWRCCGFGHGAESRWGLSRGEAPRDRSCARRERWDRRSFRAVARGGIRVSTFQCSLRPDPAAAGGRSHLFTQKGTLFTILMLLQGLRGIGPALAGNVGTGGAFALSREGGSGCGRSNARSGPIPLPPGTIRLSLGVWRDLGGGPSGGLGLRKTSSRAQQVVVG